MNSNHSNREGVFLGILLRKVPCLSASNATRVGIASRLTFARVRTGRLDLTLARCGRTSRSESRIAGGCFSAKNVVGRSKLKALPGKKIGLRAKTYMGFTRIVRNAKWDRKPENSPFLGRPSAVRYLPIVGRRPWVAASIKRRIRPLGHFLGQGGVVGRLKVDNYAPVAAPVVLTCLCRQGVVN